MEHTTKAHPGSTESARTFDLEWVQCEELPDLRELLAGSRNESQQFVQRLCDDWATGENRFDKPGEGLLVAVDGSRVVAVCGLNRDPYAPENRVGRLRRFYVLPGCRGQGLGGRMLEVVVTRARLHFNRLRVRSLEAGAFYLTHGFRSLDAHPDATHERELDGRR